MIHTLDENRRERSEDMWYGVADMERDKAGGIGGRFLNVLCCNHIHTIEIVLLLYGL